MTIEEFVTFYKAMMQSHRFGVYGVTFGVKYIDAIVDTRDGDIWSISLRDIVADDSVWAKIPEPWKVRDRNVVKIVVRDIMDDGFNTLQERIDYILSL